MKVGYGLAVVPYRFLKSKKTTISYPFQFKTALRRLFALWENKFSSGLAILNWKPY
jgi:hypothetical protein